MKIVPIAGLRLAEILVVDDNDDDVFLTREAFSAAKLHVNMASVDNGEKCLRYLRKQAPYEDTVTPDIILLDMNMPIMGGYAVLSEIVKDESLRHLVVVVLTTSYEAADIQKMYGLRCNAYITKPIDFEHFISAIEQLSRFFLTVAVLPGTT